MAQITRGKHRGQEAELVQFANDWLMIDVVGVGDLASGIVVSPTSVRLTPEEVEQVRSNPNKGVMLDEYDLSDDGKFTKRKRPA